MTRQGARKCEPLEPMPSPAPPGPAEQFSKVCPLTTRLRFVTQASQELAFQLVLLSRVAPTAGRDHICQMVRAAAAYRLSVVLRHCRRRQRHPAIPASPAPICALFQPTLVAKSANDALHQSPTLAFVVLTLLSMREIVSPCLCRIAPSSPVWPTDSCSLLALRPRLYHLTVAFSISRPPFSRFRFYLFEIGFAPVSGHRFGAVRIAACSATVPAPTLSTVWCSLMATETLDGEFLLALQANFRLHKSRFASLRRNSYPTVHIWGRGTARASPGFSPPIAAA
jgi:hypothetical protein